MKSAAPAGPRSFGQGSHHRFGCLKICGRVDIAPNGLSAVCCVHPPLLCELPSAAAQRGITLRPRCFESLEQVCRTDKHPGVERVEVLDLLANLDDMRAVTPDFRGLGDDARIGLAGVYSK